MPDIPVVLYVSEGRIDRGKQEAAMLAAASARGYAVVGLCFRLEDCAALVGSGRAALVLTVEDDPILTRLVAAAGGRTEALRRRPVTVATILGRLFTTGTSVKQLAELAGETTQEIRATLRRIGLPPK